MSRFSGVSKRTSQVAGRDFADDDDDKEMPPQPEIHQVAQSGDTNQLRTLLQLDGVSVNQTDHEGGTALLAASSDEAGFASIPVLLQAGADVNASDLDGVTALHAASFAGYVDSVRLLLESGAHVDPGDVEGFTPLFLACLKGHVKVVELLLAAGADPKVEVDDHGTSITAMEQAEENGHEEVVKLMKAALSTLS